MMYFEDFQQKYGFNDGSSVPPDAREAREVYIRTINKLAEALGSKDRAYAFDRGGFHNPFLILFTTVDDMNNFGVEEQDLHKDQDANELGEGDPEDFDDAFKQALKIAELMQLDEYIHFDIAIHASFEEQIGGGIKTSWLNRLKKEASE